MLVLCPLFLVGRCIALSEIGTSISCFGRLRGAKNSVVHGRATFWVAVSWPPLVAVASCLTKEVPFSCCLRWSPHFGKRRKDIQLDCLRNQKPWDPTNQGKIRELFPVREIRGKHGFSASIREIEFK